MRVEAETYDLGQGTAVVESELGPCGKSDLKPCSDFGNIFSLTRAARQRLDANPWVGLPASCPLPFLPASPATSLHLSFTWVLGTVKATWGGLSWSCRRMLLLLAGRVGHDGCGFICSEWTHRSPVRVAKCPFAITPPQVSSGAAEIPTMGSTSVKEPNSKS